MKKSKAFTPLNSRKANSTGFTPLNSRKANSTGFTLIELLIVVAIIGIIATIAVVATRGVIGRARIARTLQSEASMHRYLGIDIVGWWKFDGDLKDISGKGNDGTWKDTGGSAPSEKFVAGVPGKGGSALEFDGVGDYVEAEDNYKNMQELTVAFWYWNSGDVSVHRNYILGNKNNHVHSSPGFGFIQGYDIPSRIEWRIADENGGNLIRSDNLPVDEWAFVVGTFSKSMNTARLYINTNLEASLAPPEDRISGSGVVFRIGISPNGNEFIPGNSIIDDARIYSHALTSEEINTLYAETKHKYIAENNNKEK